MANTKKNTNTKSKKKTPVKKKNTTTNVRKKNNIKKEIIVEEKINNKEVIEKKKNKNYYKYIILSIVFIIGMSIGLTLGIIGRLSRSQTSTVYYNYSLKVKQNNNCQNNYKLYYTLSDGRKIYTKCIDDIKIKEGNNSYKELDLMLKNNEDIIDNLIDNLKLEEVYEDGGSELLNTKASRVYIKNDIKVVNCHHLSRNNKYNNDIYIGNDLSLNNDVCVTRSDDNLNNIKYNYDCTFTKTYNIVNLLNDYQSEIENYSYIVVDEYQSHFPKTMLIPKSLKNNLKENKSYEITYHLNGKSNNILDDIDYINQNIGVSDNLVITINIKETNKTGMNQVNEAICQYKSISEE